MKHCNRTPGDWLLVFDNNANPFDLEKYIRQQAGGHVSIYRAEPNWPKLQAARTARVRPFTNAESASSSAHC